MTAWSQAAGLVRMAKPQTLCRPGATASFPPLPVCNLYIFRAHAPGVTRAFRTQPAVPFLTRWNNFRGFLVIISFQTRQVIDHTAHGPSRLWRLSWYKTPGASHFCYMEYAFLVAAAVSRHRIPLLRQHGQYHPCNVQRSAQRSGIGWLLGASLTTTNQLVRADWPSLVPRHCWAPSLVYGACGSPHSLLCGLRQQQTERLF